MASDLVTESFNKAFTEARALYDADKLDEAVAKAEELLEDDGIPRYHRIKCNLLIAACVDDWEEADDLLTRAEVLWQMARQLVTRREHDVGAERDKEAELALTELRDDIDSLKRHHDSERPDEGVDMQVDDELIQQGATQLREQLEEEELDEEMDVDEAVAGAAGAEEDIGDEKTKHQPEHIEEEEMAHTTSTLPFRPTRSQTMDQAKAHFRPPGPSSSRTEGRMAGEDESAPKQESVDNTPMPPFFTPWSQSSDRARAPLRTLHARPSFMRTEEERQAKEEKMNSAS